MANEIVNAIDKLKTRLEAGVLPSGKLYGASFTFGNKKGAYTSNKLPHLQLYFNDMSEEEILLGGNFNKNRIARLPMILRLRTEFSKGLYNSDKTDGLIIWIEKVLDVIAGSDLGGDCAWWEPPLISNAVPEENETNYIMDFTINVVSEKYQGGGLT